MKIALHQNDGLATLTPEGGIDERAAEALRVRFEELDAAAIEELIFDFRNVDFIGSAGISKMILIYKLLTGYGRRKIRVVNVSPIVFELLSVVKLDTLFDVSPAR